MEDLSGVAPRPPAVTARPVAASAALIGVALAIRVVFFGGLLGWDDLEYWEAARALREGHFVPASSFQLRYTLTVPLAVAQAWLGEREWIPFLVPLAYSAAHLALARALGLLCGGAAVAAGTVALLALLPLDVIGATDLHADLPLAVFLAAAVYAVLRGEGAARGRRAWFFLAGLALGLGTITKEIALALLVALALRWWLGLGRSGLGDHGWLGAGFLSVTALEMLWLGLVTGHPLYRYTRATMGLHTATMQSLPPGYGWMLGYPGMLLSPLSGSFGYFAGIFYVVLAATVWGLRRRAPLLAQLGVWWGTLLALFNFAPLDPSFTRPLFHHFARTLHPLAIPFALAAALWLRDGLAGRRLARVAVVGALLALAIPGIVATHADHRAWAAVARQAAPLIERYDRATPVLADTTSTQLLRFLLPRRRERIVRYPADLSAAEGVLLLHDPVFADIEARAGRDVPRELATPPAGWRAVATFERPQRMGLRGVLRRWLRGDAGEAAGPAAPGRATLWWIPRRASPAR
jgi:hypothetical protein